MICKEAVVLWRRALRLPAHAKLGQAPKRSSESSLRFSRDKACATRFYTEASMTYAAAVDQLNAMVPELVAQPGRPRRKFSLDEIRVLLAELGNPQESFKSLLIAGTNGKGSTAATLATILSESGVRTGLYTSPHLERPNERIRVKETEIADEAFAAEFFKVQETGERLVRAGKLPQHPSYFEVLTAMAFLHFAAQGVKVAVLEVGMGGRLDATNVVEPMLSVITDISLDHMEWLGPTITAIAREKAGILRRGGTLVTLPQHPEANQVLGEAAVELEVNVVNAAELVPPGGAGSNYRVQVLGEEIEVDSPLKGSHQRRNLALAMAAAVELKESHALPISARSIEAGIRKTSWPGRLERIEAGGVSWILDVAHNPAGAWALRAGVKALLREGSPRTLVFSCLSDKPVAEMAQILFPSFDRVIVVPIHTARAAPLADLMDAAKATGVRAEAAKSAGEAIEMAKAAGGAVVVSGSVYLVGEVRPLLVAEARDER
jgi:dihydrofolate synthase / folylpolyglutamate synthase